MSFCKNQKPEQTPGPICGNPMSNLKDKICIEVNKVFDACLKQTTLNGKKLDLVNFQPSTSCPPYTFISAVSTNKSRLKDITISAIPDGSGCSRVKGNIVVFFDVKLKDSNCNIITAESKLIIPLDIVLFIPKGAVIDTSISATISSYISSAEFVDKDIIKIEGCITTIIKVTAPVDILIPTYGYCYIPTCCEYKNENSCGLCDMPLFPKDRE